MKASRFFSCVIGLIMAATTIHTVEKEVNGISYVQLNNGAWMPRFGLGTFNVPDNTTCKDAVLTALRMGYRHIATAHAYMDEQGVGEAVNEFIKESGVKRKEIWVTSKLWPSEYADPTAIDKMLQRLHLYYIDLVYLHQPVGDVKGGWANLENAVKQGKVRTLGLSNFEVKGAEDIYRWCVDSTKIKPAVMQMECHPYAQRLEEKTLAGKRGLVLECWYPLGGAASRGALFQDPVIKKIAETHNCTPAQVIIRWHIQEGHSAIPGATNHDYIQENINAVKNLRLSDKEMKQMRALNKEKRFYPFNLEATRRFCSRPLPDATNNDEWQKRMNDELNKGNSTKNVSSETASVNLKQLEKEMIDLSNKKWQWMSEKNVDELAGLFHESAQFVHMGGYWGKETELRTIKSGSIWYKKAEIHSQEVKFAPGIATVYSRIHLNSEVGGNAVRYPFIVTEVYVRNNGAWQLSSLVFTRTMGE